MSGSKNSSQPQSSIAPIIAQFFDNDIDHIAKFQLALPRIESIRVNDAIPNKRLGADNYEKYLHLTERTKVYCGHSDFEKNTYAKASCEYGECIMPCEGINDVLISNIIETYKSFSGDKYIFFDWDRTLSVVEGILSPPSGKSFDNYKINMDDILLYLIGNQERINKLKNMYKELKEAKTQIYIITNNNMASTNTGRKGSNRPEFLKIVQGLFENFPDEHIISSVDYGGDKVRALEGKLGNIEIFKDRTLGDLNQKGGKKSKPKPKSDKKIKPKPKSDKKSKSKPKSDKKSKPKPKSDKKIKSK